MKKQIPTKSATGRNNFCDSFFLNTIHGMKLYAGISAFFLLFIFDNVVYAQVAVTVTNPANATPALAASYTSLANAISALDGITSISGPVILTCDPGSETAPSGGYVVNFTATTTVSNNVVISGTATTTLTAPTPQASGLLTDAIFKIIGSDNVTIQNFTMLENAANTTTTAATNNMTEFGVVLFYASTTNGAQNNTIQNNIITLNRTYQNTWGIYSNSTHSATSISSATATTTAGGNSGLKIYGNTISNVNQGICVVGPTAAADMNTGLDIGGAGGAQANSITNWGTTGTFSGYANVSGTLNCILVRNSISFNVSFNTLTSSVGGNTVTTSQRAIYLPSFSNSPIGAQNNIINSNNISVQSGLASGTLNGIIVEGTTGNATSSLIINSNNFNTFGHTAASPSGSCIFINSTMTNLNTTINSNTFTAMSLTTSGSVTFISNSVTVPAGGSQTINSNSIVTSFSKTGIGASITGITTSGSSTTVTSNWNNNIFSNITVTGATSVTIMNQTDGGSVNHNIIGNTISNITGGSSAIIGINSNFGGQNGSTGNLVSGNMISSISSSGTITGISIGSSTSGGLSTVTGNTISGLTTTGASAVIGITSAAPTNCNILKNTICNLEANNASGTVSGIVVSAGTLHTLSNNRIGDLRTPTANASNPLIGINITGGTTSNVYYNTVNLNAMSSGALFGSSAISVSTTPTVTLDNNIFVNTSTVMGAGLAVAYRRSTTSLTTYGAASDRNDFFATTIFTDGTGPNTFSALGTYKTFVGPTRDANSVTENPPFLSTTCGNTNFLKINTTIATLVESNGANIGGITDDFENDIRFGNPGYAGTGTKPDIGADEFDGTPSAQCMGAPIAGAITGVAAVCTGLGTTLTLTGASTDLGITYQWNSSTTMGGPYLTLLGTSITQATGPLTMDTYYVVDVTCTNPGGSTVTTSEKSVLVNPLPPVMVTPLSGSYCTPGGSPVTLTASGASTYTWSPTVGLSPTIGDIVAASPPSTTIYVVTGTDGNGCINTASSTISVAVLPQNVIALATPASICTGTTSNLTSSGYAPTSTTVNNYNFAATTGAALDPMTGATTVVSSSTDDAPMNTSNGGNTTAGPSVALPFTFNYHGANYTFFSASPDGWMALSNSNAAAVSQFSNATTSTTNTPKIYPYWDDLATGTTGSVQTLVTGSAPNRIFKLQWFVTIPRNTSGAANSTFQTWLYETTNVVELRYGTMGAATASSSGGLSGGALFNSLTFATNTASNSSANDTQIGVPASGTMYTFASPSAALSYSWDPAADVVDPSNQNTATNNLSSTTIFTVTVTNSGCSTTASTTVSVDPLVCSPATVSTAHCENSNFTVTANISGGGAPFDYSWDDGVGGVYPNSQIITANLPAGMYTFTATVTDNCGSMCTSTVDVTVNGLPTVMVSPTTGLICNPGGSPVILTASGASTYSWSPTTGLTPTSGSPVSANPALSTVYTVTGTDLNGCMNTAAATVNVSSAISISSATASPSPVCPGQTATLTANASLISPPYCASLHLQGACLGDEINLVTLNTLSNPSLCTANPGYSDFTALPPTTLSVSGGPYTLSVKLGSDNSQFAAAWIDYDQDGSFNTTTEFIGASANVGINGTATFMISIPPAALNGLTRLRILGGNDSAITNAQSCGVSSSNFGETEDYTINISGAFDPFTYLWSPALYVSNTTTNPTTQLAIPTNTTFFVTVTSASGCSATGSVNQTLYTPPVVSGPSSICINSMAQYLPSSGGTWSASNGNATITNAGLATGLFVGAVKFTFTDAITGCSSSTPQVNILPIPDATITANTSIYQGSTGNIASVPSAGPGANYLWSLSSGMITSGIGTNSIIYDAGTPPSMTISVTVTSSNGCSASSSNVIAIVVPGSPTMTWEPDNITPTSCGPSTNCCHDTLCFNLKYTPGVTGFLTTYTTGFFINCLGATSPIGYNHSCVMTDNSFEISQCALIDSVLFNSSGNNGGATVPVTQGAPIILHRVCLNISTGESVQIREDNITNLSASVDQIGAGHLTEFPTYTTQTFSKPAPIIPADITVNINCPGDTLFPVTPPVVDFCGNPIIPTLISRVSIPNPLTCEGTRKYNFMYTDCSGYAQNWSFTYNVEYLDFTIPPGPNGSIVACPSLSNVVPTPPVVTDNCGRTLTPTYTDSGLPACEGFRFYVFTYTDCEGNSHNWVYAYVVEYEPIPNPSDITVTVACPLLANVVPTPPAVLDNCGMPLTPSGPTSTPALTASTCEGMRTFTWTYIDCEGNTQDFNYTYIVEREPFADPVDGGTTVGCPVQTNTVPVPPTVMDNCGTILSPSGPVVSPLPSCEGTRTYTWTYTDCEGNTGDYVYTYTVDRPPFTVPADQGSIVNCPEASNVVPVAPTVIDACGVTLIPIDTMSSAPVTCQGVDVTRTYTFHFMDCSGLTIPWVYTYTVRCFPLTLKVFLEGPYDLTGDTMKATLNANHVLPGQDKLLSPSLSVQLLAPYTPFGQPYNTPPWNYNGNTGMQYGDPSSPGAPPGVIPYPSDVVDWVLVTVRKNGILPAHNFWTCAGWVHTDGEVTFPEPCGGLAFLPGDSCYVLVQHRTHMGALSTHAATSTCTNYIINWDFTTANSYAPIFRYGEKLVEPGKWAMHAANGEQITSIAAIGSADLTTWRTFQNAYGYSIGDYNMSSQVESGGDETLWKLNQNRTTGIIFY